MKKLKVLLCLAALALMLCSCGSKITAEEIRAALPTLIESSVELNKIYFGEGFSVDEEISDVEKDGGYYYCDTSEYGLNSILEIKEATEKVFTKEYAQILYQSAFEGTSSDISVEPPRFVEGEKGLMQRANADVYELRDRIFDYKSITVVKSKKDRVTIKINTIVQGKNETIEMVLCRYIDLDAPIIGNTDVPIYCYRIDSPTY